MRACIIQGLIPVVKHQGLVRLNCSSKHQGLVRLNCSREQEIRVYVGLEGSCKDGYRVELGLTARGYVSTSCGFYVDM